MEFAPFTLRFRRSLWQNTFTMKFLVLDLLSVYKMFLSPFLPQACRFEPTCSDYARQAVEKYGAMRGTWMGLRRILRCQPFCKGGHDPVR
jgi:uncharacterized protein